MSSKAPNSVEKLAAIGRRLDEIERKKQGAIRSHSAQRDRADGLSVGLRIGVELVAAIAVGVALGYGLDLWFDTLPVGLLVGFVLGSAAGMLNVVRTARELDRRLRERRAAEKRV